MSTVQQAIEKGHYARKQLLSKDSLIAWSHRRRFVTGLNLARSLGAQSVLDYGCGDGAFLAMLMSGPGAPSLAIGVEVKPEIVESCRTRLDLPGLDFIVASDLEHDSVDLYDLVVCMEVLEHVVDVPAMLDNLQRFVGPQGRLLISVPVETGLPLLAKQTLRRIAGWRGIGDYPGTSPYTLRELISSVFAGDQQRVDRPIFTEVDGSPFHDHKGFNWMALRRILAERFTIESVYSSPVRWLPAHLSSQVWFVLRRKA